MTKCKLCDAEAQYEDHDWGKPYCWKHIQIKQTANECDECGVFKPFKDPYTWGRKKVCEACLKKLSHRAFLVNE